jgi:hypothetical protein
VDLLGNTEIPRARSDMFYVLCIERSGGVGERRGEERRGVGRILETAANKTFAPGPV